MPTSAEFWDRAAQKYAKDPIKNIAAYEETLRRTAAVLEADAQVLEIGCGTGTTALRLAPSVARYTGTDISAKMIEIAQGKAEAAALSGLHFKTASAEEKTFENNTLDAILAFNMLHLADDLDATLSHIMAQLKPGGRFISKTMCLRDMGRHMTVLIPLMQWIGKAPHVNIFTARGLEAHVARAGFAIVESLVFDGAPHARFLIAEKPTAASGL